MAAFADFDLTDRQRVDKRILHWSGTTRLFQIGMTIEKPCRRFLRDGQGAVKQAVVEVLAADMRGERRDTVRLRDAAPSGGLILSVRRDLCGLRELLQFTKAGEELFVRESKYSFTLRRATDSEAKQPPSAKRPRARTAADMAHSERQPTAARRSVYEDLASISEEDPAQLTYAPHASGRSPAKRGSAKKKVQRVGPKRAMTSYFFFAAEARSRIAAARPELSMTEQAKEMGAEWKRMADSEKQAYVEMAKKDQERYESEKAEYYKDYPQPSPKRKNTRWSEDEMGLLKSGVKKFGAGSWARILSSYEFSESRTAVDLKDKWRNMNKHEAEDA